MTCPPHRCVSCARVRYGIGQDFEDHPGILAGEVAVICATCTEERRQLKAQEYLRNVRRTVRRQTHKEPWAPGTTPDDPFDGMREPRADKARG